VRARAPASSSNLGPGYDVLALALALQVEVEVTPAASFSLTAEGEGANLAGDDDHLAAEVVRHVLGHDRVTIRVSADIPVARGLGSSAALALAAAAAAGADDPLAIATSYDGHAENAAASMLGGLVAATIVSGHPVARRLPLDARLGFVVVVPERELATKQARSVLPGEVDLTDATFNLGRMGLLVAGLADASALVPAAGDDRLHQDHRTILYPEAPLLLDRLRRAGAIVACWSGAGPSLLAICVSPDVAPGVRDAGEEALAEAGLPGRALLLAPDLDGLVVSA
jgi:homoserine kinase